MKILFLLKNVGELFGFVYLMERVVVVMEGMLALILLMHLKILSELKGVIPLMLLKHFLEKSMLNCL